MLGMATGCAATSSDGDQEQVLDDAIHSLERTLGRYLTIDPNGPAEEVVVATDRVSSDWAAVVDAAEGFEDLDVTATQAAHDALIAAVAEIPEDAVARDAVDTVQPYIDDFAESVEVMHEDLDVH